MGTTLTTGCWWNSLLLFIKQSAFDLFILTPSFTCLAIDDWKVSSTFIENFASSLSCSSMQCFQRALSRSFDLKPAACSLFIRKYKSKDNSSHFPFLTNGLKTVLDSASCPSPSSLLPASPYLFSSATLPFLQLPGHHYSRHGRLVPLCLTVHLDLGSTPVDKVGFAAQSTEGLTVNFLKLEFKCILIANVLRMVHC